MIDTHCHLTDRRLEGQAVAILERCKTHGVAKVITIATTPGGADDARALADRHEMVYFAAGIHPCESGKFTEEDVAQYREFMAHPKCVALGEIGLDLHWKDVPLAHQITMFRAQLALARKLGKPVVIHSREAIPQTLEVMRDYPEVRAVFHCFTGTAEEAHHIFAQGYYMGFDGPLTYKKNDSLRFVAAGAPADLILIETDAPYLAPEPHRSVKVNEPMYVRYVLEALAKARNLTIEQADLLTTRNANSLFGIAAS